MHHLGLIRYAGMHISFWVDADAEPCRLAREPRLNAVGDHASELMIYATAISTGALTRAKKVMFKLRLCLQKVT